MDIKTSMMNNNNNNIEMLENKGNDEITVRVREPKKILYFSDGMMEEFSSDEEDESNNENNNDVVDESQMTWGPWIVHKAYKTGSTILAGCDYAGEKLASAFGITTPKYNSEIEEFKRIQEEKAKEEQESAGWEKKNLAPDEIVDKEKF